METSYVDLRLNVEGRRISGSSLHKKSGYEALRSGLRVTLHKKSGYEAFFTQECLIT